MVCQGAAQGRGKVAPLVREFLRGRVVLKRCLVLIDSRHGVKDVDREMIEMLDGSAVGYRLVLTKADKIKASELDDVYASTSPRRASIRRRFLRCR
jgi:GTP-binding protein EngB required for normal cell division